MEKEKILSTFNERLSAEGIKTDAFQRTFNAYIDANLPAEGTEPDDAYWQRHVGFLKSLSGQFNHDVAQAVKEQTKNVTPPANQNPEPPKPDTQPNKEVEELRKTVAGLVKRLDDKEALVSQQQLLEKVKAEMKSKGAADEYVLRQTLKGVTLDAKKSVADLTKEMLEAYDAEYTACRGKGAAPRSGQGSEAGKGKNSADDFFARKQKKEGWGGAAKK